MFSDLVTSYLAHTLIKTYINFVFFTSYFQVPTSPRIDVVVETVTVTAQDLETETERGTVLVTVTEVETGIAQDRVGDAEGLLRM